MDCAVSPISRLQTETGINSDHKKPRVDKRILQLREMKEYCIIMRAFVLHNTTNSNLYLHVCVLSRMCSLNTKKLYWALSWQIRGFGSQVQKPGITWYTGITERPLLWSLWLCRCDHIAQMKSWLFTLAFCKLNEE